MTMTSFLGANNLVTGGRSKAVRFAIALGVAIGTSLSAYAVDDEKSHQPVKYEMIEDVVYGQKDGMGLTLDVLTPEKPKGIGVILVSSGGWKSGKSNVTAENRSRLDREHWVQGMLQGGYTLFLARHGSSPRYLVSEMVDDIRRSVRFVRLNVERFHVDPNKLVITSGSSGGHLSLMVATTGDDGNPNSSDAVERTSSRVQAVVAWFPPTDLINWGMPNGYKTIESLRPGLLSSIIGKVDAPEEPLKAISPIYHVSADDPPLYLVHGDRDLTVPVQQSKIIKSKYEEVGLPVELVVHKGGGHTYWPGILDEYPAVWTWIDKITADKTTAPK